jgi:hypothetical protein
MSDAQQEVPNQTVNVGFGKALAMFNPNWREELTPDQVNSFRHFYNQGVNDVVLVTQLSQNQLNSGLQAIGQTIIRTGNEAQIAEQQRLAAEAAEQAAAEVAGEAQAPAVSKAKAKKAVVSKALPKAPSKPAKKAPARKR